MSQSEHGGYLRAVIGAVVGGLVGLTLVPGLHYTFFSTWEFPTFYWVIEWIGSYAVGQVLGCWFALNLAEQDRAGKTAVVLLVLLLLAGAGIIVGMDYDDALGFWLLLVALTPGFLPLVARWGVNRVGA
jgi:hypothetical protein